MEVVSLGNGRYQLTQGTKRHLAFAVGTRNTWVFLNGRTYLVSDTADRSRGRSRADEQDALTAPMPATVLAIHVVPGQRVHQSEVLILLEAMKMELPIRSPRDGIVKAIGCQVGELIQPGTTLIELENAKIEG